MNKFAIITDTSADLSSQQMQRFGIDDYVAGYVVYPDGHSEQGDPDWNNIKPEAYYDLIKNKDNVFKTAQPSPLETREHFERFLKEGRDVLSISLSSGLSGTYSSCTVVARELMEQYPDRKIICVDSLRYSACEGLICIWAARLRDEEGMDIDQVAAWLEKNKSRFHQMGSLDDLFFCSRMGRVSFGVAIAGTLIGIKPLADFSSRGMSEAIGKVRGYSKMIETTIEYMRRTIIDAENQIIFVAHTNRLKQAERLKEEIQKAFNPKEIIINYVGQTCGTSIGPGLVAAFYYGTETTADLKKEKALLSDIIGK